MIFMIKNQSYMKSTKFKLLPIISIIDDSRCNERIIRIFGIPVFGHIVIG